MHRLHREALTHPHFYNGDLWNPLSFDKFWYLANKSTPVSPFFSFIGTCGRLSFTIIGSLSVLSWKSRGSAVQFILIFLPLFFFFLTMKESLHGEMITQSQDKDVLGVSAANAFTDQAEVKDILNILARKITQNYHHFTAVFLFLTIYCVVQYLNVNQSSVIWCI